MANPISDDNLLIYNPKTAKIIFSIGSGVLSKATKIMSSLTQALILFSDKVVNQNISYIRFANHRMVFLFENDLYALKMVPKDHLPKDYLPSMKIVLGLISGSLRTSSSLQNLEKYISDLYRIIKAPDRSMYVFSKSVQGYKSCLVFLAGLSFDLSINLENIRNNITFINPEKPKELNLENMVGLLSFTQEIKYEHIQDKFNVNLNNNFPFVHQLIGKKVSSPIEIIQHIFGPESNATKTADIIVNEDNLDEIIGMIVKVDSASGVDFAIKSIDNYNKDQKVGKTLYQLVVEKLNSIEEQSTIEPQSDIQPVYKPEPEKVETPIVVPTPITEPEPEPKLVIEPEPGYKPEPEKIVKPAHVSEPKFPPDDSSSKIEDLIGSSLSDSPDKAEISPEEDSESKSEPLSSSIGNFSSLASEFTTKMKDLYESDEVEATPQLNISQEIPDDLSSKELLEINYEEELSNLTYNKFQIMMQAVNLYVDLKPFVSGNLDFDPINYRPSLQAYTNEDYSINIEIKIHPIRHQEFFDGFHNFIGSEDSGYEIKEKTKGVFIVGTDRDGLPNLLRLLLWLMLIDYSYNVQQKVLTPTDFFNIKNGSICVIPDGVTPERKKHLPSNITEIIEEAKLLKDEKDPVSIVETLDHILLKIHSKLKAGKGKAIGLVPRPDSKEIPLIFEFVLTLSELTGIGWSRW